MNTKFWVRATDTGWAPTVACYRAACLAIALMAAALMFRRPDLLVLATPAAVVTVWSVAERPLKDPRIDDRLTASSIHEGGTTTWHVDFGDHGLIELATVYVSGDAWTEIAQGSGITTGFLGSGTETLAINVRSTRWGHQLLGPMHVSASSSWGAFRNNTFLDLKSLTTLPVAVPLRPRGALRPARGLVGAHQSARRGEGTEFAGVRDYRPGDRVRRINWNRTLRATGLQINSTSAEHDTHVELVIDNEYDLGVSGGIDGRASSLDLAARAAGAIAQHYVSRGDRVSLQCLDQARRTSVPPGTGHAHLRRLLETIARIAPAPRGGSTAFRLLPGATDMTVLLSPLITAEALGRAVELARHGRSVVVVDTMPDCLAWSDDPVTALAWRIRTLERRREIRLASDFGIVVVRWAGPASLDRFLRDLALRSAAPRVRL